MKKALLIIALALGVILLVLPYLIPLPQQPDLAPEEAAPPTGRFVTVGGVQTYVEEAGPDGAPAVVLIHGFGGSTFSWRDTLPALAEAGYRAVALDLKGFGLADKRYGADYSHPAQADFTAGVMDVLGIERATMVGHSMGGSVVAHFAQKHPGRVDTLVIVDGAVNLEDGSAPGLAAALVRVPPLRRWGRIALRLLFDRERLAATLTSAAHDPDFVTDDVVDGYRRPLTVRDWDLALLGIVRDSGANTLPAPLSTITAPTLLVWGEADTWVPLDEGRTLHAQLPNSELVTFPQIGHLPMEEAPAAFNAALLDFLAAHTVVAPCETCYNGRAFVRSATVSKMEPGR